MTELHEVQPGLTVQLSSFCLWNSTDYTIYPRYLSRAEAGRTYTLQEITQKLFLSQERTASSRRSRANMWRNIWDVERVDDWTARVRGVCLVEAVNENRYQLTDWTVEMCAAYRDDPAGIAWRARLADILARFDPRLRILLYHLGALGYTLQLPRPTPDQSRIIAPSLRTLTLHGPGDEHLTPFQPDSPTALNRLMRAELDVAIGPFLAERMARLGLPVEAGFASLTGIKGSEPDVDRVHVTYTRALKVFQDLGILAEDGSRYELSVDHQRATELLSLAVYADLFQPQRHPPFLVALHAAYLAELSSDGYAAYDGLRRRVTANLGLGDDDFHRRFRAALKANQITILRHARGLPSDGPGYEGQPEYQLLDLGFAQNYAQGADEYEQ